MSMATNPCKCVPGDIAVCVEVTGVQKQIGNTTCYVVQNLSSNTANISHGFCDGKDLVFLFNDTIPDRSIKEYSLSDISNIYDGFTGTVIVRSDQPIEARITKVT